ncbi:MAG: HAD family hydrolase [Elainellaceae cyanobacterium]
MGNTPPPKVIFFDAVGTLFGVKGSVGAAYAKIARQFGVQADPQELDQAFSQSFRAAPPMAFPNASLANIPQQEYEWWQAIAQQTFDRVKLSDRFARFSDFFTALYEYFETADPWFIYPDVDRVLRHWQGQNVHLGIISNFDTRIYSVLPALGLSSFFSSVTISTEVGAAKPDVRVFQAALEKYDCPAAQAWHVGDSLKEDYEGAKAAGLRAIWLNRSP